MSVERLYRRMGFRYLWVLCAAILLMCWALAAVWVLVIAASIVDLSASERAIDLAIAGIGITLAWVAGWVVLVRRAQPLVRWIDAGRPSAEVPAVWQTIARLPGVVPAVALPTGAALVGIPAGISTVLQTEEGLWGGAVSSAWTFASGIVLALIVYLALVAYLQPVVRDLAMNAPADARIEQPGTLLTRRILAVHVLTGFGTGLVVVGVTASAGDASVDDVAKIFAVLVAVTVTMTLGLAALHLRPLSGAVSDLLEATRRVRTGDLQARVPVVTDDELGVLASSFNEMTSELQRSREQLVTAREEERRRLRRDLHDGLGPSLAAQAMRIEAATAVMRRDPDAAETMLGELRSEITETIADVRRLVHGLRPPQLDELGLVGSITQRADQLTRGSSGEEPAALRVSVEAPHDIPSLPAAVEVAAYRIVQEALTNVVRHSQAASCGVRGSPSLRAWSCR